MLGKLSLIGLITAIAGFGLMYVGILPQYALIIGFIGGGLAVFSVVAWIIKKNSQKIDVDFDSAIHNPQEEKIEKREDRLEKLGKNKLLEK